DLLETVDMDGRAGLAANQIGVSLRAFSWNIDGEGGYVLNPVIVDVSEEHQELADEGCLSIPGLWFESARPLWARAEGADLDGKPVVVERGEIWAGLIHHEVDHLDGHLFIDRLAKDVRKKAMKAIRAGIQHEHA